MKLRMKASKKIFQVLFVLGFVMVSIIQFTSCNSNKREDATDLLSDSLISEQVKMTDEMVGEMITSVPNPVEMTSLLQRSGVVYSQEILNPTTNISKYNTNFKKALNLGVYGTDLVYMNIYDRTVSTLSYLKNLTDLANDLRVGQFFDRETLSRLSESSKNIDSVLFITNSGFDKMSRYLIEQKRSNLAVLVSYGTWIESLSLATRVKTVPPNKETIYSRIGEQKVVLDNMILLLHSYKNEPNFKELIDDLFDLKKEFDKVKITYVYAEPTMKEVDGMLVIVDNSSSQVIITDEIVEGISNQIEKIRSKIIE